MGQESQELDLGPQPKPWTAALPMLTGSLSILGSYLVIRELWGNHYTKSSTAMDTPRLSGMRAPIVRALIGLSLMDFLSSIAHAFSTLPSPPHQANVSYAYGNYQTCAAQGFFKQLGLVGTPLLTTLVTFFYLATIKNHWSILHIHKMEMWSHSIIWIVSLACAVFPIPLGFYNNHYNGCWLSGDPFICDFVSGVPCERGHGVYPYWIFFSYWSFPWLMALVIMMVMIYRAVRNTEITTTSTAAWGSVESSVLHSQESQKVQSSSNTLELTSQDHAITSGASNEETSASTNRIHEANRTRSSTVAVQGCLFVLSYFLTEVLKVTTLIRNDILKKPHSPVHVVLTGSIFMPLQGFFNAIVLLRTSKLRTPEGKFVQAMSASIFRPAIFLFSWLSDCSSNTDTDQEDFEHTNSPPTSEKEEGSGLLMIEANRDASGSSNSVDILGAHDSRLFNESNLIKISSVNEDDSIARIEGIAQAKLNREIKEEPATVEKGARATEKPSPLYSEFTMNPLSPARATDCTHGDLPQLCLHSPRHFVSDLTEECCLEERTFDAVVEEHLTPSMSKLPRLYGSEDFEEEINSNQERSIKQGPVCSDKSTIITDEQNDCFCR